MAADDRRTHVLDRPLSRRDLLKAGAGTALLALVGCGDRRASGSTGPIVRAAIHPAIGFARVGNSPDEFYLGPEIPGGLPIAPGGYKDATGAMKRQAARFRVFGLDADGRVVRELTAHEAEISWTVHLANEKASWFQFDTALDIPEAEPAPLRNQAALGGARSALVIDPGARTVSGTDATAQPFDTGTFLGEPVYLGELRTDAQGRLLVLGGRGRSFSPGGAQLTTFANNDGWTDDVADGPVSARVRLDGAELPVDPAWVVVAPPNYAPALATDFRTLYDVVYQTMLDLGWVTAPAQVDFLADVYPLFDRLVDLQWVNQGILNRYGWGSPEQFTSPEYLARLSDPSPANAAFRQELFARFRDPDYATLEASVDLLPPLYGDAITLPPVSPRSYLAVLPFQYAVLERWAAGDFSGGLEVRSVPSELEDLPVATQAAALDRAALEACLGDAFHPGCEATWPMRVASMYASPFRLLHRAGPEPDYGTVLTPAAALSADGPLAGCTPGAVSRWMAVPWQTDTASCRSGYQYEPGVDPYLPTFWAARVPNHVMPEQSYERVMDRSLSLEERRESFFVRAQFFRAIDRPSNTETLEQMVRNWYRLGVVTEQPGPGDPDFPELFKVETDDGFGAG